MNALNFDRLFPRLFSFILPLLVMAQMPQLVGVTPHCGAISVNETWTAGNNIHVVTCDVTVEPGVTLTIEPGAIIKLQFDDSLFIDGKLTAIGTANAPIYFTSYFDDSVGGDTNGDGPSTGTVEDWGRIRFNEDSNDTSLIQHAIIRYSGNDGTSGADYAAIGLINASPGLQDIQFEHNYLDGIDLQSSTWSTDVWDNNEFTYYIRVPMLIPNGATVTVGAGQQLQIWQDMTIAPNGQLIIEEGAIVKFGTDDTLFVDGTLSADGSASNPIYFTSFRDDSIGGDSDGGGPSTGAAEDWGRIQFSADSNDNSRIEHAIIRFSGNDGTGGAEFGAITLEDASPMLRDIQFHGNYLDGAELITDFWSTDSWDNVDVTYFIRNPMTVLNGNTLTVVSGQQVQLWQDLTVAAGSSLLIDEGAIIKLGTDDSIFVAGHLSVTGTEENPVYFTSFLDDSIGGDSDGGGSSSGNVEDWGRIHFYPESDDSSTVQYAIIRYGGNDGTSGADFGAITIDDAAPTVANTQLSFNYRGIELFQGATPTLTCNDIHDNDNMGLYNDMPTTTVNAENHWWGSTSGPTHTGNPGGTGEMVSDGINYTPWADQSCVIPEPTFGFVVYLPITQE